MSKEKPVKEIDVESLDAELAAARKLEENKNTLYGKIAAVFALTMSVFHILTVFRQWTSFLSAVSMLRLLLRFCF